ncbi:antibiotic biosynthesis monooxygenase family protein [Sphingomonas lycopersici]|uniref:Antibiotic biosynthesis monooxygenase n=1 Tax=Sphingomonas lycopersici TaxID=2951807 RepID=A0AA42CPV6_9SPHN|nr:antibiotic biosynthesis monooxygenase [Sphingomonas lycopersici]MCW6535025.1 antibiotic biosynthesis monooxygenase [Sphingomonas lycopersici]
MHDGTSVDRAGQVAVIFISQRTAQDGEGYAAAAAAMDALAAAQPGYRGVESVRDAEGRGITVSYWATEAEALAWRANPDHAAIRDRGRAHWYENYQVIVTRVERGYGWTLPA